MSTVIRKLPISLQSFEDLRRNDYIYIDKTEFIGTLVEMSRDSLSDYRPTAENPIPVFFQAGYLTIQSYNEAFEVYSLAFPNKEVKQGFFII